MMELGVVRFTELFYNLISSGFSLSESLSILSRPSMNNTVRVFAEKIENGVKHGLRLSEAMKNVTVSGGKKVFPDTYISLMRNVDKTGNLIQPLRHLCEYFAIRSQMRERMFSAVAYPAFIVCVSIIGTAMLFFKGTPYLVSLHMIGDSTIASMRWGITTALIFLILSILIFLCIVFKFVGKESIETRIFRILFLFSEAGLPVTESLPTCILEAANTKAGIALVNIKKKVSEGAKFDAAFRQSKYFSPMVLDMIAVGCENADQGKLFEKIYLYYAHKDLKNQKIIANATEPVLIIITGVYLLLLLQTSIIPIMAGIGGYA